MNIKIVIFTILVLLGNQKIFSQNTIIKGKVIDYETHKPIWPATVCEGLSTAGILSEKDGSFEINLGGNTGILEVHWPTCYSIKIINIPIEHKHIDFGNISMVTNYRTINTGPGVYYTITDYDKECDNKMRKNVLKKYRIKILGKKMKPYFEYNRLIFDFNKKGKNKSVNHL